MKKLRIGPKIALVLGVIALIQAAIQLYVVYSADQNWLQSFGHLVAVILTTLIMVQWLVHKMVIVPLRQLTDMVKDIAQGEGDLTKRVSLSGKDEIAYLARIFNLFIDKLQDSIGKVGEMTNQVASESSHMSKNADEMARGAESTNSRLTQSASAVDEMTMMANEVARNSQEAAGIAKEASETAQNGQRIVEQTVKSMQALSEAVGQTAIVITELGKSSDQIGEIVGTIEDIADQTNLLALNAAIEAARAGEQGRGFAVVADEVRKLAERTTRATHEIGEMIRQIQGDTKVAVKSMEEGTNKVTDGVSLAHDTSQALTHIQSLVLKTDGMIQQIAAAAHEQSSTTVQIARDLEAVAKVGKETTEGAAESAKRSHGLHGLSEDLQGVIGRFKV
ncbi:MAG: methyl-accepting chemotaxis protein [Nitrospirota bacterium]|nr:methyl-accepting chemotaxis protein [Nitrospirota bacterium]